MGERRIRVLLAALAVGLAACGSASSGSAGAGSGAVGASSTTTSAPAAAAAPSVPGMRVEHFSGDEVALTDYAGTPLVVNFWASWCPPCLAEMPDFEEVHQLAGDDVAFVGVNTSDLPGPAATLAEDTGVTYDLVRDADGRLLRAFGVIGMPSTFYVDADGMVVARHTGLLTRAALIEDLRTHLGVEVGAVR